MTEVCSMSSLVFGHENGSGSARGRRRAGLFLYTIFQKTQEVAWKVQGSELCAANVLKLS